MLPRPPWGMLSQQTLMELSLCFRLASNGREMIDTVGFRFWPHSGKVEMPASLTPSSCAQPGPARAGSELNASVPVS